MPEQPYTSRPLISIDLQNAFIGIFEYKRRAYCTRFGYSQDIEGGGGKVEIQVTIRAFEQLPGDSYGQSISGGLQPENAIIADRKITLTADTNHFVKSADGTPFEQGAMTSEEWEQAKSTTDYMREWDFYLIIRDNVAIISGDEILHHMSVARDWGRFD